MASRKTLGYIQNEWTCPNCSTRNKGGTKTCENCGAPQPENVQFELGADRKFVTDENQVKAAQAGADIHCGFCGTRNPATAETCSQCGGDLKEGKARESGRVMQAPPPPPKVVTCTRCGTENPGTNSTCSNCGAPLPKAQAVQASAAAPVPMPAAGLPIKPSMQPKQKNLMIGLILGVVAICVVGAIMLLLPSRSVEATVTDIYWQTSVPVQELQPVKYSNEQGNPPSDAYDISCRDESKEVCEEKTVDKGNGYSEVVQECYTETEQYCDYTVDEWETIQTYTLEGNDLYPVYESPNYSSNQRLGTQSEQFSVTFSTDRGEKTYKPDSVSEFQQFEVNSVWTLKLNLLGGIVSVKP